MRGIFPVLQTPLDADGELDIASLRREVRFCIEAGAHGLVFPALGSELHPRAYSTSRCEGSEEEQMKITDIRAVQLNRPPQPPVPAGRRPSWWTTDEVANPMS